MRTILPFASNPLHLQMSPTQTTEAHDHAPAVLNPQQLSRPTSPQQQSNLSLLVCFPPFAPPSPRLTAFQVSNGHAALRSPPPGLGHPSLSPNNPPPTHSEPSVSIQSILSSAPPSAAPTNGQQPTWNGANASSRDNTHVLAGPSSMPPPPPPQVRIFHAHPRTRLPKSR